MLKVIYKAVLCELALDGVCVLRLVSCDVSTLLVAAALNHEFVDDAVEDKTVVCLCRNQLFEVLNCAGSNVGEKTDYYLAVVLYVDNNVICGFCAFSNTVKAVNIRQVDVRVLGGYVVCVGVVGSCVLRVVVLTGHKKSAHQEHSHYKTNNFFHF